MFSYYNNKQSEPAEFSIVEQIKIPSFVQSDIKQLSIKPEQKNRPNPTY